MHLSLFNISKPQQSQIYEWGRVRRERFLAEKYRDEITVFGRKEWCAVKMEHYFMQAFMHMPERHFLKRCPPELSMVTMQL